MFESAIRPKDGIDVRSDIIILTVQELIIAGSQNPSLGFCSIQSSVGDWVDNQFVRIETLEGVQLARFKKILRVSGRIKLVELNLNDQYKLSSPPMPGGKIEKIVGYANHHIDRKVQETQEYIQRMTRKLGRSPTLTELKTYL